MLIGAWWVLSDEMSLLAPVLRVASVICRDEATCQIKQVTSAGADTQQKLP